MDASDNFKNANVASSSRAAAAPPVDLPTLADKFGASLAQRLEGTSGSNSAELGYGCVDWFIYGAESRAAAVPLRG